MAETRQAEGAQGEADRWVKEAEALVWTFREAVQSTDPLELRSALRDAVDRVECFIVEVPTKSGNTRRRKYRLDRAIVHLRADEEWSQLSTSGS